MYDYLHHAEDNHFDSLYEKTLSLTASYYFKTMYMNLTKKIQCSLKDIYVFTCMHAYLAKNVRII